jgi:hypothetical protein
MYDFDSLIKLPSTFFRTLETHRLAGLTNRFYQSPGTRVHNAALNAALSC